MSKTTPDLLVLAAGMGSRFGGLKQVQPVGPNGELIIEYSVYDAMRAGFDRVVLVIRKDIEADFRETVGRRLEGRVAVDYVFQEAGDIPEQVTRRIDGGRTKPWGTGHAVWTARRKIRGTFAVINADDFYGASGYRRLAEHFARSTDFALVGYPLLQTLSEQGSVSRGVCATGADGRLIKITEITKIHKAPNGAVYRDEAGNEHALADDTTVSMNFWGFTPEVFGHLGRLFSAFLNDGDVAGKEFYLPTAISRLNESEEASVSLLHSEDLWFGLTYREDIDASRAEIRRLVANGTYPTPLWSG